MDNAQPSQAKPDSPARYDKNIGRSLFAFAKKLPRREAF